MTDSEPVRAAVSAAMASDRRFDDLPARAQLADDVAMFVRLRLGWRTEADIERYIDWRLAGGYRVRTMAEMNRDGTLRYLYQSLLQRPFSESADQRRELIEALKWERRAWPGGRADLVAVQPVGIGLSRGVINRDPRLTRLPDVSGEMTSEAFVPPGGGAGSTNKWIVAVPSWPDIRKQHDTIEAVVIALIVETNEGRYRPIELTYLFNAQQGRWFLDGLALLRARDFDNTGNLEVRFF
ncbi:MAG: hypothetical protein IBJ11_06115 [Phycisphaerales bacterium]|nr:hypothetical protein [Phycisphaerales bacterium]